jgi:hypothetical protein
MVLCDVGQKGKGKVGGSGADKIRSKQYLLSD